MTAVSPKLTRKTKGGAYGSGVYGNGSFGSGVYGFSFKSTQTNINNIISNRNSYHQLDKSVKLQSNATTEKDGKNIQAVDTPDNALHDLRF